MKNPSIIELSKDNNFNLLRFLAASGVFLSHCFPIADGTRPFITNSIGYFSVNLFFIISGFLICRSLLTNKNFKAFAFARVLRIYPALIICVLLMAFVLGLGLTNLSPHDYLNHPDLYAFIIKNSLLWDINLPQSLAGVTWYDSTQIINGPLWTLPYELHMYVLLGVLFYCLKHLSMRLFKPIVVITAIIFTFIYSADFTNEINILEPFLNKHHTRFIACFFGGASAYLLFKRINFNYYIFLSLLLLIVVTRLLFSPLDNFILFFALPYLVLFIALKPAGVIRRFNQLGDYSYGIYIYGFPIQYLTMQLLPQLTAMDLLYIAYLPTVLIGAISWQFIEKPMLQFKRLTR